MLLSVIPGTASCCPGSAQVPVHVLRQSHRHPLQGHGAAWGPARAQPGQGESCVQPTQAPKIQGWHSGTLCLPALGHWPLSAGNRLLPWPRVCRQCPSLQSCPGARRMGWHRDATGPCCRWKPHCWHTRGCHSLVTAFPGASPAVPQVSSWIFLTANVRETQRWESCQKGCSPRSELWAPSGVSPAASDPHGQPSLR